MLYDTFNDHPPLLKIIVVHHITIALIVDLTSKRVTIPAYYKIVHVELHHSTMYRK